MIGNAARLPLAAAAGLVGVLLVLLAAEWWAGSAALSTLDHPAADAAHGQDRPAAAAEIAASPEAVDEWVRIALARPLMSSSRHASTRVGSSVNLSGGLPRLTGTLTGDAGRVAIFARDETGHPIVVREGGTLGPYRVSRIAPNAVTLDGPSGSQTVRPRFGARAAGLPDAELGPDGTPLPQPMNLPGIMPQLPMPGQPFRLQPQPPLPPQ